MIVQRLPASRWRLLTLGTRQSLANHTHTELEYWTDEKQSVLGMVARDNYDQDFAWMLLARDALQRFRAVRVGASLPSLSNARNKMRSALKDALLSDTRQLGIQGDEQRSKVLELLRPDVVLASERHQYFDTLLNHASHGPARAVMNEIGPWLEAADPHFLREFHTAGFDQRLWELYLWCALRTVGLDLKWLEAPDLVATSPTIELGLEATAIAPSTSGALSAVPQISNQKELETFLQNYMPMKFGSGLTSKLNKTNQAGLHYWERAHTKDKPFLFAIADFHRPATRGELGSMCFTQSALWQYLYGLRVTAEFRDGVPVIVSTKIHEHSFNGKTVPSGFFDLPGAENVSGVLFSNAGTLAKFNRMGIVAGYQPKGHTCVRAGLRHNPAPGATMGLPFSAIVGSADYEEDWADELQLFHNPRALHPVAPDQLPGIAHHWFVDGDLHSLIPEGQILSSHTVTTVAKPR